MTANKEELSIPLDLSVWVPCARLREWIKADTAALNWSNPELVELLRRFPEFEPQSLLNTMTLAYATGVFGADEIARRCSVDPEFRAFRPKLPPLAVDLRKFRKENRGVLKWCLSNVITNALKTQFVACEGLDTLPSGLRRYVVQNAIERLDIARHMDRGVELM